MNALAPIDEIASLPALIDRAASALSNARSSAEVLEAKEMASFAYDAAKRTARLAKAKNAHDELIGAAHRAQAHALEIEAQAKHRLADEYDAAQERGEVAKAGGDKSKLPEGNFATVSDLGLSHKDIHEARIIRDAEKADPGIVRRVLDEKLEAREEPTKAALRQAVIEAAERGIRGNFKSPAAPRVNPNYKPDAQWDAMLAVSAGCRDMMDKVRGKDPAYILGGFISDGQRARNLADIRECRDFLNRLLEAADGQ